MPPNGASYQPQRNRIFVDGETEATQLVYSVAPEVPAGLDITATVLRHAVTGNDGRPPEMQYELGPEKLAQAAIDAVKCWPDRISDPTAEIDTTIEVAFLRAKGKRLAETFVNPPPSCTHLEEVLQI